MFLKSKTICLFKKYGYFLYLNSFLYFTEETIKQKCKMKKNKKSRRKFIATGLKAGMGLPLLTSLYSRNSKAEKQTTTPESNSKKLKILIFYCRHGYNFL